MRRDPANPPMPNLHKSWSKIALRLFDAYLQRHYEPYLAHFRKVVGYQPTIALPIRYHEKMLWRKLFDRSPRIALFCDKLATREFIRDRAPGVTLPELLWVGDSPEAIPEDVLTSPVVFKCNHGCEYNYFWHPGKSCEMELKKQLACWMGSVYGQTNYEWGYTLVRPRIMAERMLAGPQPVGLLDINVRAASGNAVFCSVISHNKTPDKTLGYFDIHGNRIRFANSMIRPAEPGLDCYNDLPPDVVPADVIREAVRIAGLLGKDEDYARFDFLYDGAELYAGEITCYPASGLSAATMGSEAGPDNLVNDAWDLRRSWFLTTQHHGLASLYSFTLKKALD